ncbi:unnamed protein product, partial [marine sediment metagenome]
MGRSVAHRNLIYRIRTGRLVVMRRLPFIVDLHRHRVIMRVLVSGCVGLRAQA